MRKQRNVLLPMFLDFVAFVAACVFAAATVPWVERIFEATHRSPEPARIAPIWATNSLILLVILLLWGCYWLPRHWNRLQILRTLTVAHAAFATVFLLLTIPIDTFATARKTMAVTIVFSVFGTWYWRLVYPDLYGRLDRRRRAILLGAHTYAIRSLQRFARENPDELEILGVIDDFKEGVFFENLGVIYLGGRSRLKISLRTQPADTIIVLTDQSRYASEVVSLLEQFPVVQEVYVRAQIPLIVAQGIDLLFVQEVPLLKVYSIHQKQVVRRLRGVVDQTVALAGLIVLSPLFALVALFIKLESQGPIFYWQKRLGRDDRAFWICKFRSMGVDAERERGAVLAEKNDPRVTRVGRILRKLRIDELPQLLNIVRGEMSLIGPRPERPEFQNVYRETIPWYSLRSWHKPGLTGLAQVSGDYHTSAQRKLLYDVTYLANIGWWIDLRIMAATVLTVLTRSGH